MPRAAKAARRAASGCRPDGGVRTRLAGVRSRRVFSRGRVAPRARAALRSRYAGHAPASCAVRRTAEAIAGAAPRRTREPRARVAEHSARRRPREGVLRRTRRDGPSTGCAKCPLEDRGGRPSVSVGDACAVAPMARVVTAATKPSHGDPPSRPVDNEVRERFWSRRELDAREGGASSARRGVERRGRRMPMRGRRGAIRWG